jgi:HSP90 family molecular chaperone
MKTKKFFSKLISNCSDTCDKIRHKSLKNTEVLGEQKESKIDILSGEENKCISITDEEIEMIKTQLISNLDTIARSGTRQFMKAI